MRSEEDRLRESMLEYLGGAVSPEDLERLNRAVERDPQARRDLAELMLQETLLYRVGQESQYFELDIPQRRPGSATTSRILKIRTRQESHRQMWIAATIAATVLFALSVLLAVNALNPQEAKTDAVVIVNRDASAPPAPEERPAPAPVEVKPGAPSPAPAVARKPAAKTPPAPRKPKPVETKKTPVVTPEPIVPAPDVQAAPAPAKVQPTLPVRPPTEPVVRYWETVIAKIERAQGDVTILSGAVRLPTKAGQPLTWGQGLETGAAGSAILKYADGTRVELGPRTVIWETSDRPAAKGEEGPKRIRVAAGAVTADVTKQAAGRAMVLMSAHGEARILGTSFKLIVELESMRLEMKEGKIQVTRKDDQAMVDVGAGFYVVVGKGLPLEVKPLPPPDPASRNSRSK